ncbi:Uncharacterised protein [Salmonella enterica subsp. salamae]|uniref:Uncharacterized protein n=1 Tax=Salmonella enterica TaxID=28901 RepID=A0A379SDA0_SALER|nr:Uncharacterised protein [Salmonella enterica]SUJ12348.1 Uncharacterised protein [Salmonella enterica subsp. salamae]
MNRQCKKNLKEGNDGMCPETGGGEAEKDWRADKGYDFTV